MPTVRCLYHIHWRISKLRKQYSCRFHQAIARIISPFASMAIFQPSLLYNASRCAKNRDASHCDPSTIPSS